MIETIIFDMDGVMIDSEPLHFQVEEEIFEKLGISIPTEEHHHFVGLSPREMWRRIASQNELEMSVEALVQLDQDMFQDQISKGRLKLMDGFVPFVKRLFASGFRLVVASSSPSQTIEQVLHLFDLNQFFKATTSGSELTFGKPHPQIFLNAAALAQSLPQNCLVIEDSENGVKAAKAAHMKCIGYANSNSGAQNLQAADFVIKSYENLDVAILRGL